MMVSMAADHIEPLRDYAPELFSQGELPNGFDTWDVREKSIEVSFESDESEGLFDIEVDFRDSDDHLAYSTTGMNQDGWQVTTPHGPADSPDSPVPPPDAAAFYLPFHYFGKELWGIYVKRSGVENYSQALREYALRDGHKLDELLSAKIAMEFLYFHELWHHKVECFALRLEVTHRRALFIAAFEDYYRYSHDKGWPEEALANAYAFREVMDRIKLPRHEKNVVERALRNLMADMPPGYRDANRYLTSEQWTQGTNSFAETHNRFIVPIEKESGIWNSFQHEFNGFLKVGSKFRYILTRDDSLFRRERYD